MLGWWWQQPDQFDWFSAYLRDRGLQLPWRIATVVFTVLLGAIPVTLIGSSAGPQGPVATTTAIAAAIAACGAALLWLFRWPTRVQSLAYTAICGICIAAGVLTVASPYSGLMGCTIFAAIGGFIAYFHAMAHVLANNVLALACAAMTATRLFADTGDIRLVIGSVLLVITLNVGVPFGIYTLVHSLHIDLRNSDRDPLTGLLNRRSFYNTVHEQVVATPEVATTVNVTMVDLDKFKRLNDSRGHAVGDAALVEVAAVLQQHAGTAAVLSRLGGEEFVVADVGATSRHVMAAERIRDGIAALQFGITASLGVCSTTIPAGTQVEHPEFIERLIHTADAAMYRAKRAGGDRVEHRLLGERS
ncbi:GGDEF domain-containing protein [Mycobacterium sp. 236(2023)]|uniref:GGDEF domain-containing protein n=1 Tax=Mycobacterium sp. 236(2023) TaxID=3038163 RepID=UPI002414D37A|nr:GGDEF domain-containing protein [Mycobacterium sp. 236(2023)]MDG4665035.1 GGDEF domain-containing protein [Mycobacterium sp. 236(2023)]